MAERYVTSEKPVLEKLRFKPAYRAAVLNAPESYQGVLAGLPDGAQVGGELAGSYDFLHCFATRREELERAGPGLRAALAPGGLLWVSYPKGKAIPTDLNRDSVNATLRAFGLQGVAQVAIDEVWSALRFKAV